VAIQPPEMTTRPSLVPLQKHSPGGCIIYKPRKTAISRGTSFCHATYRYLFSSVMANSQLLGA